MHFEASCSCAMGLPEQLRQLADQLEGGAIDLNAAHLALRRSLWRRRLPGEVQLLRELLEEDALAQEAEIKLQSSG